MEIVTHVLTNEQHYLDDKRKKTARANIEAIGSIKINGNVEDNVKGDVADLTGVVVPTPSAEDNKKVLTAGKDGSYGWNALPEGLAPYDGEPAMDGEASAGSSTLLARGDHVHPSDTSKANKSEMSVTTDGDRTTITLKEDTYATVINAHQDISGKVDKVDGKGLSTNDFTDNDKDKLDNIVMADKADKVASATNNHLASLDASGNLKDSGVAASDVATTVQNSHSHSNKAVLDEIPVRSGTDSAMLYSADDSSSIAWKNWSYVTVSKKTTNSVLIGKNWYPYVKIGNLYWTTENLREPIGTKNTDYWVYDENTAVERGYIYKHDAVLKGVTGVESDALLALLHDGWHIPTQGEAGDLIGREPYYENNGNVFFATDADRITPQSGVICTDKYGFHAYPSGTYRASGYGYSDVGFHGVNTTATFYTKTYYPAAGQVYAFYARFHDGSVNSASFSDALGGETGLFCCVRLCKSAT